MAETVSNTHPIPAEHILRKIPDLDTNLLVYVSPVW